MSNYSRAASPRAQAEPLAPNIRLSLSSQPDEDQAILPNAQIVYTTNLENRSTGDPAVSGAVTNTLPSRLEIVSATPATDTQQVSGSLTIITWDTGAFPNDHDRDYVLTIRLPDAKNVLHTPIVNQVNVILTDGDGDSRTANNDFTHYAQSAGVIISTTTEIDSEDDFNERTEAVAGELVTFTVYSTIPTGTIAYSYTPFIWLGDGLVATGANPTPVATQTMTDTQGDWCTRLEFAAQTITNTNSASHLLTHTIYAYAPQHYFMGDQAGQEILEGDDLEIQPVMRWCGQLGCAVDPQNTDYVQLDVTDKVDFTRPNIQPRRNGIVLTYLDSAGIGQGDSQVRFDIEFENQSSRPTAYNVALTATLGPGLTTVGGGSTITQTGPISMPDRAIWDVSFTATLPSTFVVGAEFSWVTDVYFETFEQDVPNKGQYINNLANSSYYPGGYFFMPGIKHEKHPPESADIIATIGDTASYTVVTTLGGGTLLPSPNYTDTLSAGYHYISNTFALQNANLVDGPTTSPGALDDEDAVLENLYWAMADLDNLAADTPLVFTATYQAVQTGYDAASQAVYGGDVDGDNDYRDIRNRKDADNSAALYFADMPTATVYLEPAVGEIDIYQPYMGMEGSGGLFATSREGTGNVAIGDSVFFRIEFKNNAAGEVDAYEVQVCDTLPPGMAFEQTIFTPPTDCIDATYISQPSPGDQGTICWVFDKVCAGVEFAGNNALKYETVVLPSVIPGVQFYNYAHISDYTGQAGDDNPHDRHYGDFTEALPAPAQCAEPGCPFTVLGLAGSKHAQNPSANPGDTVIYTLAYTDTQPSEDYGGVVISDVYDSYLTYVNANPSPTSHDPQARLLTWDIGDVPSNSSGEIILTMDLDEQISGTFVITNAMIWNWAGNPEGPRHWLETIDLLVPELYVQMTGPITTHSAVGVTYTVVYYNQGTITLPVTLDLDYGPHLIFTDYDSTYATPLTGTNHVFVDQDLPAGGVPHTLTLWLSVTQQLPYTLSQIDNSVIIESAGATPASDGWSIALDRPIINLDKDGPRVPPGVGSSIDYTIDIANLGNYTATNIAITETWDADTSFSAANVGAGWEQQGSIAIYTIDELAIGEVYPTIHFLAVVNSSVVSYANTVSLSSDQTTVQSDSFKLWQESIQTTKSANADPAFPGRVLTYTIHYTNTDDNPILNASITDYLPDDFGYLGHILSGSGCPAGWEFQINGQEAVWTCDALQGSAEGELQIWGTVTSQLDPDQSDWLVNTTESDGDYPTPLRPIDEPLHTLVARPHLGILKSDADIGPVAPGDTITYTLTYSNYGSYQAEQTKIKDHLPSQVIFVSCSPTCTHQSGIVAWDIGEVSADKQEHTVTIVATVNANTQEQTASNDYTIESQRLYTPIAGPTLDTHILNPHLTLTKEAYPDAVDEVNDPITYTITYHNDGGGTLTSVMIEDQLPALTAFVGASPQCSHSGESVGGLVTCTIGSLIRRQQDEIYINVANVTSQHDATILNQAQGDSDQTDPTTSNEAFVWVDTDGCWEIRIADFVNDSPRPLGTTMHFTATPKPAVATPPISYLWDLGDGNTSDQATPSHNYTAMGIYTVTLTVDNPCDQAAISVTYQVQVTESTGNQYIYLPVVVKND